MDEVDEAEAKALRQAQDEAETKPKALLQAGVFSTTGWRRFDDISLSLTAGCRFLFMYDLYTPHTPERPVVRDENRVAAAPVMFEGALLQEEAAYPPMAAPAARCADEAWPRRIPSAAAERRFPPKAMAASVESTAPARRWASCFSTTSAWVTVGRGQSAMCRLSAAA